MARIKRWGRVVLETQLDRLSRCIAGNLGNHAQSKVDSGGNAARGDDIAVLDDAGFLMRGADQRQQPGKRPVCRGATALQQPGGAENEGSRAHRSDVLRGGRLPTNELYRLPISHRSNDPAAAARYADQIQPRAILKGMRRYETEAAIAGNRRC